MRSHLKPLRKWPVHLTELSTASITDRLAALGSERWAVHYEARRRIKAGEDIIELTIGEPDIPTPIHLIDIAEASMRAGRTGYAGGKGEPVLLDALADKYSIRTGRDITTDNVLALPGTQAALAVSMLSMVEKGDAVVVPDPYYATYEGVVQATGADFISVPTNSTNGFKLTPEQLEAAIVPNAKVLLLNSPHNPTGAVLNTDEIAAIGKVCARHNLWILSDEVYEPLIYSGSFASAFDDPELSNRTVVVSSISKSHAAPGFRSGWAVGPSWFIEKAQSVAESFLFGNQPFIADMTAHAVSVPDDTAARMSIAYRRRIDLLMESFGESPALKPNQPASGMFMMVDVHHSGLSGAEFAMRLLDHGVAVMPGDVFGNQAKDFIRISLTVPDDQLSKAATRIIAFTNSLLQTTDKN